MSKKAAKKVKTQSKKAAQKVKTTQATKSKRSPSKGKKPARRVAPRTDIGILSSIPFASGSTYRNSFEAALGARVANAVVQDDVGYDPTALGNALAALTQVGSVKLIVTIGGVTPALAVADAASHNRLNLSFLSLVGSTQDSRLTDPTQFLGAVDLQNVEYDPKRIDHLVNDLNLHLNEICLLQNTASDLKSDENNEWTGTGGSIIAAYIDKNTAQISSVFNKAFNTDISNNFRAVIISGDPYYTKNAQALVKIANGWTNGAAGRRVVYPFDEYKSHGPRHHTIHGPELKSAFARLGDKIAQKRWGIETMPPQAPDDH